MTSIHMSTSFDPPRPMSQQGLHSSPAVSPKPPGRSASQASLHLAPLSTGTFSPALPPDSAGMQNGPLTSFPGQFRPFTPAAMTLPIPHTASYAPPPPSAPPMSFYPNSASTGYWDGRNGAPATGGHAMMRTISHAHPMNSATEHTASTRYSPSPHSAGGLMNESPPSASVNHSGYHMSHLTQPTINVQDDGQMRSHINPSLFNNQNTNYPMSRSTSGASVSDNGNEMGRLLTPHYEYREGVHDDMRKVSDPMNFSRDRLYPASYAPSYQAHSGHGLGLGPHPQPTELYFRGNPYGDHYALSSERSDVKPSASMLNAETEYERERQERIMENERLFQDVGLAGGLGMRQRSDNGAGHRNRKPTLSKKRSYGGPVRASGRIASVGRASYADLDGNDDRSNSSDEYSDAGDEYDDDEFRPSKKPRGRTTYAQRTYNPSKPRRSVELSLWGLLQVYPEIPHLFPLFYYTLNNDLTINSDSVPLIGSIPSTCSPQEKAEGLRRYHHRGRRVLAQLDAFSSRCDRKYDGPDEKWPELDYHTRIAVRDVRRKVVERCENYKYTRRDILDKAVGKNKWQPIEAGMIDWHPDAGNNDPAGDLANVTLTMPTPPASAYPQQHQQPRIISQSNGGGMYPGQGHAGRTIRPFPRRNVSQAPHSARIVSVNMDGSSSSASAYGQLPPPTAASGMSYYTSAPQTAPPMYGEDDVPMTVQLPSSGGIHTPHQPMMPVSTSPMPTQNGMNVPPLSAGITLPTATHGWASAPVAIPASAAHTPVPTSTPMAETATTEINGHSTPEAIKRSSSAEADEGDDAEDDEQDDDDEKPFDATDLVV